MTLGKVVCVLYNDPIDGYPPKYARDDIPNISTYPGGQTTPTTKGIHFKPGTLLGCVSGELGIRQLVEDHGYEFIVTSDKDGDDCEFEKHLSDAVVIISQPFWPAYMTEKRFKMAPKLKLCITAGIGSDHVDLEAAAQNNVTVAEVTYSNSISVSEHVVMLILSLVRNYIPCYKTVIEGGWNIADCVSRSYDIEGMHIGTVAGGRIGQAVLKRLKPFDVHLHYTDHYRLPEDVEKELGVIYHPTVEDMVKVCDVVTINCPLHPQTEHLFDATLLSKMKRGAYLVNTARGKICDRDAIRASLEAGHLGGYAGDVWFPQPAPEDHPWRHMPHHAMTPHVSGTTLSAQARYAAGTAEILEAFFDGKPLRNEYLIVDKGQLAGAGKHSYTQGDVTKGSEEASKYHKHTNIHYENNDVFSSSESENNIKKRRI
ncbi:Formate dehydrogenase, putative [Perkinsus marinus ATCC 50983]|uniref:Formate dehydrogenase n=1 Tax=Perkinsus marinus (strain ATCC 50983 / TXsc) TaxID=423536 RepID=C5KMQ1_PERM5|nr:Formate dehydrogenase, putative [Perkinsus marinus ATCC 50983]EER14209.1 Formate dehydrogenase, putative [Perkinsus marinus ATCC 50983]|eukprot:XP_002782414.1 Formate dehydrogenase, putative [Perkinsus marinus ATCC 50983]